jgi:hypothetical protein
MEQPASFVIAFPLPELHDGSSNGMSALLEVQPASCGLKKREFWRYSPVANL